MMGVLNFSCMPHPEQPGFDPTKSMSSTPEQDPSQIIIPETEFIIDFVRSSGKGGQNVNKTNTKAQLRWNVGASTALTPEQKEIVKVELATRINLAGEVVIMSQEERSQVQNKRRVIEKLHQLVHEALAPVEERIATKPKKSAKERRLHEKAAQSKKKAARKWQGDVE
jgi:ribosome-associated protein